jgi:hypothetical protein
MSNPCWAKKYFVQRPWGSMELTDKGFSSADLLDFIFSFIELDKNDSVPLA